MEREKIKELLRKYYDGLTSTAEEEMLRDLLNTPAANEEFASDRMLLSVNGTPVAEPSAEFLRKLEAITLSCETEKGSRRIYMYIISIAAGVALMLGSYYVFRVVSAGEPADTFTDPELAMAEVRNILFNVSQNMNTGTGALKPVNTMSTVPEAINEMGRTARSVDRSLSRLRYLNDLNPAAKENDTNKK